MGDGETPARFEALDERMRLLEYATAHALIRTTQTLGVDPMALAAMLKKDAALIGQTPEADEMMLAVQPLLERWARRLEQGLPLHPTRPA
jgi:hypothetical protein